jgi:hypothetical protein
VLNPKASDLTGLDVTGLAWCETGLRRTLAIEAGAIHGAEDTDIQYNFVISVFSEELPSNGCGLHSQSERHRFLLHCVIAVFKEA